MAENWPPKFTMTPEAAISLIMQNYEQEQNRVKTELLLLRIVNEAYEAGIQQGTRPREHE